MRWLAGFLLASLIVAPALAQTPRLQLGAIGGVSLTEGMAERDESRRYTIGPAIEVAFGDRLAVELNALYQRLGAGGRPSFEVPFGIPSTGAVISVASMYFDLPATRVHSWEFPILGKYYFGNRAARARVFVQTGYAFQRSCETIGYPASVSFDKADRFSRSAAATAVGAVFGGGFARKAGPVTLTPSFRYTRWGSRSDGANQNQAEILLGLWF